MATTASTESTWFPTTEGQIDEDKDSPPAMFAIVGVCREFCGAEDLKLMLDFYSNVSAAYDATEYGNFKIGCRIKGFKQFKPLMCSIYSGVIEEIVPCYFVPERFYDEDFPLRLRKENPNMKIIFVYRNLLHM